MIAPGPAAFEKPLALLDPAAPPTLHVLAGDAPIGARLAVLSGSFNPPTLAHVGLASAALAADVFDRLLFTLATRTINKEQVVGATMAERCAMLAALAAVEPRFALAVTNRGLYLDQARAAHSAFRPRDLCFIVGFDKIVQIIDPRYYADRDQALRELFTLARFLVAPRDGAAGAEMEALFAAPENRLFAHRVRYLPLDALTREAQRLSSTQVRAALARGEDVEGAVPDAIAALVKGIAGYRVGGEMAN